jgi:BCD family chlorophyll transporter-like MFS transporter
MTTAPFGWLQIIRLGLVQTALGAIVVLTTSTLNRVMVVELALPAIVPGLLVALHHAVQLLRPRWGYGSDRGGRRTPWIIGGMAILALGGLLAACSTALMTTQFQLGLALGVFAFALIGIGTGAAGTSVLVLLAQNVDDRRRAPAATIVWVMMIAGFIVTAGGVGHMIDPYSPARLIAVSAVVSALAFALSVAAIRGLEGRAQRAPGAAPTRTHRSFAATLAEVWGDRDARRFTIFIFVSMLAYSAQDLILEPYAGLVFGMTPGETTKLGGLQNGGVLIGMVLVGLAGHRQGGNTAVLRGWMVTGCLGSALALSMIAGAGSALFAGRIDILVFGLGFSNGVFAVSAIGAMMGLAASGPIGSRGTRMGVWGAAQAVAFGSGGLAGTVAVDSVRLLTGWTGTAYQIVFAAEGILFLLAAAMAVTVASPGLGRRIIGSSGPRKRGQEPLGS